jgi:uncharacterized membrane protein
MKEVMARLTEWLGTFVELLKVMIVLGVAIGILYGDIFGVITNIGNVMKSMGQQGLAGLVALALLVTWYK